MAVVVDIPGFGAVTANNAAEESTMREILAVLKRQSKGGGPTGGGGGGGGPSSGPSSILNGLSPKLEDFSQGIAEGTNLLQDFSNGLRTATKGLMDGLMGLAGSAMDLGMEFISGGNRMSDFAQHIPLVGGVLSGLTGFVEQNVDAFRDLSDVGASFGNNITEMQLAAAQAGLGLNEFSELVGNNADRLMLLGGTVTEGAKAFGRLQRDIRRSNKDFEGMGFTIEQLGEHTAEFMEMQARQGKLSGMTEAQLRQGTEDYLMQIDRLAKVTGKSRKEAEALLKQQNAEANVLAMKMKLEGQQLKNFENNLAFVDAKLPGFGNAIKDMADGVAQTPLAQKLAATIPGFQELQTAMGNGTVSQEEYAKQMAAFGPQIENMLKEMDPAQIQALMGKEGFDGLLQGISDYRKMSTEVNNMDFEAIKNEQQARDKTTSAIANFEDSIAGARGTLMESFIESGLFKKITDVVGDFTSWFTEEGEDGVSNIEKWTKGLLDWVSETVTYLKDTWDTTEGDGFMDKLGNWMKTVWDEKISPKIGSVFTDLVGSMGKSIWEAIVNNLDTILIGLGAGILAMIFAPIAAPFLAVAAALAAMFGWEYIKDLFGGIFDWWEDFSWYDLMPDWAKKLFGGDEEEEPKDGSGGKKKKSSSWWPFGGDEEESDAKRNPDKQIKETAPGDGGSVDGASNEYQKKKDKLDKKIAESKARSGEDNSGNAVNTSGNQMALLQEQNRLLKQLINTTRGLQGNLMKGVG